MDQENNKKFNNLLKIDANFIHLSPYLVSLSLSLA